MVATGSSLSFLMIRLPAVAVYLMLWPPTSRLWRVTLFSSLGMGLVSAAADLLAAAGASSAARAPRARDASESNETAIKRFICSSFEKQSRPHGRLPL